MPTCALQRWDHCRKLLEIFTLFSRLMSLFSHGTVSYSIITVQTEREISYLNLVCALSLQVLRPIFRFENVLSLSVCNHFLTGGWQLRQCIRRLPPAIESSRWTHVLAFGGHQQADRCQRRAYMVVLLVRTTLLHLRLNKKSLAGRFYSLVFLPYLCPCVSYCQDTHIILKAANMPILILFIFLYFCQPKFSHFYQSLHVTPSPSIPSYPTIIFQLHSSFNLGDPGRDSERDHFRCVLGRVHILRIYRLASGTHCNHGAYTCREMLNVGAIVMFAFFRELHILPNLFRMIVTFGITTVVITALLSIVCSCFKNRTFSICHIAKHLERCLRRFGSICRCASRRGNEQAVRYAHTSDFISAKLLFSVWLSEISEEIFFKSSIWLKRSDRQH